MTRVHVLVENEADSAELQSEHGLAVLVEGPGRTVLVDAARSAEALLANAGALGVDLRRVDSVVVTHGHYDHTAGLEVLVRERPGLDLYAHPDAFLRRWSDHPGKPLRDISCPHTLEKLIGLGAVFHAVRAPERVEPWLVLSGPVGGAQPTTESFVVLRGEEMVPDTFHDELFVLIQGQAGWSLLTGCCHRGLRNTLRAGSFLTHGEPIVSVIGGLHLRNASPTELEGVADLLTAHGSPQLHLCHCTGDDAIAFLADRLDAPVRRVRAGDRWDV